MAYQKHHIMDFFIDDESAGAPGRELTISVDSHEKVTIEIGNSVTIRTDEDGAADIIYALDRALAELKYNRTSEAQMVQTGIDAREADKAAKLMKGTINPPEHMLWNPNDPRNW